MKFNSRRLGVLLTLSLGLVLTGPISRTHAAQAGDFTYEVTNSVVTLTGYTGSEPNVTVPEIIDGLMVTVIGQYAFIDTANLQSITIPGTVHAVGPSAFSNCRGLVQVNLPEGLVSLGPYAFSGSLELTHLRIPATVVSIGPSVVSGCPNLAGIDVEPENPAYLSVDGVLFNRSGSVLLQYPKAKGTEYSVLPGVSEISDSAFSECSDLVRVDLPDGLIRIGDHAFAGCEKLDRITLPASVDSVGQWAFNRCFALSDLVISDGVRELDRYAFASCTALTGVQLPASLRTLGDGVFSGCTSLKAIEVDPLNPGYSSSEGVLFSSSREGTFLVQYPPAKDGDCVIPPEVTGIRRSAFSDCVGLTGKTIPEGITVLEDYTFSRCSALAQITIPEGVTEIGRGAFSGCTALCDVVWPGSLRTLEDYALYGCRSLRQLSLPGSLTYIGVSACTGCTSLTSLTVPGEGYSGLTVERSAFEGCTALATLEFPLDRWVALKAISFRGCTSLTHVYLPKAFYSLSGDTFADCSSLTAFEVDPKHEDYSSVDGVLFNKDQTQLIQCPEGRSGQLTIPKRVKRMDNEAFQNCGELTAITMEAEVRFLRAFTFEGCRCLERIVLPASLGRVDLFAFYDCPNLTGVYFEGDLPSIYCTHDEFPFKDSPAVILYYRPGTLGWTPTVLDRPTAPWIDPPLYAEWLPTTELLSRYSDSVAELDDPDQDGMNNHSEMLAGTNPADPKSVLVMEQAPRPDDLGPEDRDPLDPDQQAVFFRSVPGKHYGIQWADEPFGPYHTEEVVSATTSQKRAVVDASGGRGYFRVVLAQ